MAYPVPLGEKFSAGDVLIEVETDKAQMDVEAPEDGIMFKILVGPPIEPIQQEAGVLTSV